MMDRRQALLACGAIAFWDSLRAQNTPQSQPADFDELSAAFEFFRARNAKDYALTTPNAIDDARYFTLGGIDQWVTIRGENRANPALLVLHGGPGDATSPWGYAGFQRWLKTYTVVQWDQRGSGRTLGRNGPASATTLTIERMVSNWRRQSARPSAKTRQDRAAGALLGLSARRVDGEESSATLPRIHRHGTGRKSFRPL